MIKKIATIDLGSNSFHMLISEINNNKVKTITTEKSKVQLRAGLTDSFDIDDDTKQRAIECLSNFSKQIKNNNVDIIEAVGTYTLRKAENNISKFKKNMEKTLGAKISIISGNEEARLIFLGASKHIEKNNKALIIDIGGGSTEFIIGENENILISKSLEIGCVEVQQKFFKNGEINFTNFHNAINYSKEIIKPIVNEYKKYNWNIAIGSSGTIQSLIKISNTYCGINVITKIFLNQFISQMIDRKTILNLEFDGLRKDKEGVIAGGTAILYAIFDVLNLEYVTLSKGALREGILYEIINNKL